MWKEVNEYVQKLDISTWKPCYFLQIFISFFFFFCLFLHVGIWTWKQPRFDDADEYNTQQDEWAERGKEFVTMNDSMEQNWKSSRDLPDH